MLSDEGKRTLYDAGLFDPFEEDEEVEVMNCLMIFVKLAFY